MSPGMNKTRDELFLGQAQNPNSLPRGQTPSFKQTKKYLTDNEKLKILDQITHKTLPNISTEEYRSGGWVTSPKSRNHVPE